MKNNYPLGERILNCWLAYNTYHHASEKLVDIFNDYSLKLDHAIMLYLQSNSDIDHNDEE